MRRLGRKIFTALASAFIASASSRLRPVATVSNPFGQRVVNWSAAMGYSCLRTLTHCFLLAIPSHILGSPPTTAGRSHFSARGFPPAGAFPSVLLHVLEF